MTTAVERRRFTAQGVGSNPGIVQLLAVLGMHYRQPNYRKPRSLSRRGSSFWEREHERLSYILRDAHDAYRRLARDVRTDLVENHEHAAALNSAWTRIKLLFARHGVTLEDS